MKSSFDACWVCLLNRSMWNALWQMVFTPEIRPIHHEYSDILSEATTAGIPCNSIQEVLSEKLRALIQRSYTAPRDFYDIWYLPQNVSELNWSEIVEAFHKKMKFKNIDSISTISTLR